MTEWGRDLLPHLNFFPVWLPPCTYLPVKMEQIERSETSAYRIQTPGELPGRKHATFRTRRKFEIKNIYLLLVHNEGHSGFQQNDGDIFIKTGAQKTCEVWGFRRSLTENSSLPGYDAARTGNRTPRFREKIVTASWKVGRIYQPYISSKGRDTTTHWRSVTTRKNRLLILSDLFGRSDRGRSWRTFSWLLYWRFF